MNTLATLFLTVIIVAGLTVLALYLLFQIFKNFQPGKRKVASDVAKMKAELAPYATELVPWTDEEIELLSLNQINRSSKHRVTRSARGVFTSVFHEPMIAWSYRSYLGGGESGIYYVRTSQHELEFWKRKNETQVTVDGQVVGFIRKDGALLDSRKKKILGYFGQQDSQLALPIVIGDRELGRLATKPTSASPNPRAFELLKPMDQEQEKAFLALSMFQLIRQDIEK